jgi:hypothetical protein
VLRRHLGRLLWSIAALATTSACVDEAPLHTRDIVVRPRVVVDGTVELSDRTAGRVQLSGIAAHAHEARVAIADGGVVVDDSDPLFFSFAPTRPEDQVAAERLWSLPVEGGDLRVGFGPASVDDIAHAPFDAAALTGHTVVITGTIAITPADGVGGLRADDELGEVDPDGTPADEIGEVDPDGTPAEGDVDPDGTPADQVGDVDPDGTPADVDPDGTPADQVGDVDPDGTPADVDPDGTPADVDPDGTPADQVGDVDPDGTPAIDPDGTPAIGGAARWRESVTAAKKKRQRATAQGQLAGRPEIRVPFTLTVDGVFEHRTTLGDEAIAAVGDGEVLPIDLRFQAGAFFDAERLAILERLAREAVATGDEDGAALQVSAATTSRAVKVEVKRTVKRARIAEETSSKIVVTGPLRK